MASDTKEIVRRSLSQKECSNSGDSYQYLCGERCDVFARSKYSIELSWNSEIRELESLFTNITISHKIVSVQS